jgi:hypothetical protein
MTVISLLFVVGAALFLAVMVLGGLWYLLRIWKRSSLAPKPRPRS